MIILNVDLASRWQDDLSQLRCEIEADFYVLLAMTPDNLVRDYATDHESAVLAIAEALGFSR